MENMMEKYVAPEVQLIECQVEKGFATSTVDFGVEGEAPTATAGSRGWSHGW